MNFLNNVNVADAGLFVAATSNRYLNFDSANGYYCYYDSSYMQFKASGLDVYNVFTTGTNQFKVNNGQLYYSVTDSSITSSFTFNASSMNATVSGKGTIDISSGGIMLRDISGVGITLESSSIVATSLTGTLGYVKSTTTGLLIKTPTIPFSDITGYSTPTLSQVLTSGNTTTSGQSIIINGSINGTQTLLDGDSIKIKSPTISYARGFSLIHNSTAANISGIGFYGSAQNTITYGYAGTTYNDAILKWNTTGVGIGLGSTTAPVYLLDINKGTGIGTNSPLLSVGQNNGSVRIEAGSTSTTSYIPQIRLTGVNNSTFGSLIYVQGSDNYSDAGFRLGVSNALGNGTATGNIFKVQNYTTDLFTIDSFGVLKANNAIIINKSGTNSLIKSIYRPCEFIAEATASTGAIVVKHTQIVPTILQIKISIYCYATAQIHNIDATVYSQSAGVIGASGKASLIVTNNPTNFSVNAIRTGIDASGNLCVIIGDVSTAWSTYLKVVVDSVKLYYTQYNNAGWESGWSVGIESDLTAYTAITSLNTIITATQDWTKTNFIQNQNASAQTANGWITGSFTAGNLLISNNAKILGGNTATTNSTTKFIVQGSASSGINNMTLGSANNTIFGIVGNGLGGTNGLYGLYFGSDSTSGRQWIQGGRTDGTTTAYDILLQGAGGNVGIGITGAAGAKLHVAGTIRQTAVISSLVKTNTNGDIVAAVAGTDYLSGSQSFKTINGISLLGTGDFGLFNRSTLGGVYNANTATDGIHTNYQWSNTPYSNIASLSTKIYNSDWISQEFDGMAAVPSKWIRSRYSGTTWSPWYRLWSSADFTGTDIANWNTAYNSGNIYTNNGSLNTDRTLDCAAFSINIKDAFDFNVNAIARANISGVSSVSVYSEGDVGLISDDSITVYGSNIVSLATSSQMIFENYGDYSFGFRNTEGNIINISTENCNDGIYIYLPTNGGYLATSNDLFSNTDQVITSDRTVSSNAGTYLMRFTNLSAFQVSATNVTIAASGGAPITLDCLTGIRMKNGTYSGTFYSTLSGDRTYILPNESGTLALTSQFEDGTYTPTITGSESYAPSKFSYIRVGKNVHVSGRVEVAVSGGGDHDFTIELPISTNISTDDDLIGVVSGDIRPSGFVSHQQNLVYGNTSTNHARVTFSTDEDAVIYVQFDYVIN